MYSIGEASRLSGVNIETIRYYEREGILPAPERTASGRRVYDANGLSRLSFVKTCRDLGFAMNDTKTLLSLATAGGVNCGEAKPVAVAHLAAVTQKIEELVRLRDALVDLVGACGDPASECPMLKVFFEAKH